MARVAVAVIIMPDSQAVAVMREGAMPDIASTREPMPGVAHLRIAVAVDAAGRISGHLGRAERFSIYSVTGRTVTHEGDVAVTRESGHACAGHHGDHHHDPGHDHQHDHGAGHHATIINAVTGCNFIITLGAGPRIIADLAAAGIAVVGAHPSLDPARAVEALLEGGINLGDTPTCRHGTHH